MKNTTKDSHPGIFTWTLVSLSWKSAAPACWPTSADTGMRCPICQIYGETICSYIL